MPTDRRHAGTAAAVVQRDEDASAAAASQLRAQRAAALVEALAPHVPQYAMASDELGGAIEAARGMYRGGEAFSDDYINSWSSILQMYAYSAEQLSAEQLSAEQLSVWALF